MMLDFEDKKGVSVRMVLIGLGDFDLDGVGILGFGFWVFEKNFF